jgi:nucleotide-binding universal stress UspA family protein
MKRFKNILFYTDGNAASVPALARAVDLAQRNQGRLTVASVLEELPRDLSRLAAALPSGDIHSLALREVRERLESFVAPLQAAVTRLHLQVLYGKPFIEVIRAVLRHQYDLVVLAAEGQDGLREMLFGSHSLHLMRKCPCPVWVLKPAPTQRFARILAAVDPDPLDVVRDGVNLKVLELATSLAALEGSELHVVHAWEVGEPAALRGWQARVSQAQVDDWAEQTREAHQRRFDELLARFDLSGLPHRLHLLHGPAGTVVPQLAAEAQIDLIVMGTVARAGLAGYFIGNTAETVVQHATCSVLTVKPEGFVSPVTLA